MNLIELLLEYVKECDRTIFVWGTNDCCTFVSNWVEKVTGKNPMDEVKISGTYDTEQQALQVIEGISSLDKAWGDYMGEEIHTAYAQVGDIVLGELDNGPTLGICIGVDSVFLGVRSIIRKRTCTMNKAWRV